MRIRKARESDVEAMLAIYGAARAFMFRHGNPSQWGDFWPPRELVERYAAPDGNGYVVVDGKKIAGAFGLFINADESAYRKLDGRWLNDEPYAAVHTLASSFDVKGVGEFVLNRAVEECGNVRIDTHKNNVPMLKLLGKLNFAYIGEFDYDLEIRDPHRLAFQKIRRSR